MCTKTSGREEILRVDIRLSVCSFIYERRGIKKRVFDLEEVWKGIMFSCRKESWEGQGVRVRKLRSNYIYLWDRHVETPTLLLKQVSFTFQTTNKYSEEDWHWVLQ